MEAQRFCTGNGLLRSCTYRLALGHATDDAYPADRGCRGAGCAHPAPIRAQSMVDDCRVRTPAQSHRLVGVRVQSMAESRQIASLKGARHMGPLRGRRAASGRYIRYYVLNWSR